MVCGVSAPASLSRMWNDTFNNERGMILSTMRGNSILISYYKLDNWLLTSGTDGISRIILDDYAHKTIIKSEYEPKASTWRERRVNRKCQVLVREMHSKNVKRNVWSSHVLSFKTCRSAIYRTWVIRWWCQILKTIFLAREAGKLWLVQKMGKS